MDREMDFGTVVGPAEYGAITAEGLEAVHVIERCISAHHVVEVDYVNEDGVAETFTVRPAFIRYNKSRHAVVWWMPPDRDGWRELRLDRLRGARDTGAAFTPTWASQG